MFNDKKYILNFQIVYNGMVSTNEAYFHMPKKSKKSNRMTTYTVKTDKLKELQKYFNEAFKNLINDDYIKIISDLVDTKFYGLKIVTLYSMPYNNYRDSDVTNYIKNYEDCIASRLREFNKNLDDKNNIEFRAVKRFRVCDSDEWKISTIIYPIERDIWYRSSVLKLFCPTCNDLKHFSVNNDTCRLHCVNCGIYNGLDLDLNKRLYGITKTYNDNQCSVCGSEVVNGICEYCGIDKNEYYNLINNFNEESIDYED